VKHARLTPKQVEGGGALSPEFMPAVISITLAFPIALGRRPSLPAIKSLCVVYVELVRGGLQSLSKGQSEAAAAPEAPCQPVRSGAIAFR
jgi:ABC-type amino acid transport system permease subunit